MVYVVNIHGQPLMPTERHAKVRKMLKSKKAIVYKRCPFTIQLTYETENITQDVTLGIDAGSKTVGVSATTDKKVLYESEVELRNDVKENLSTRREFRRSRRNRNTRYRMPRFDNRTASKKEGWLAPSVKNKADTHLTIVRNLMEILPITKIVVETASFDTQKLKAELEGLKLPEGEEYQQGNQLGFWNVREYVLFRDNHTCACCHGKSKDKILNVHHIESRKTGSDSPSNLITLCETCHKLYHQGKIELPKDIKKKATFSDAAFMGIMRWAFFNRLKEEYKDIEVKNTYGYITKNTRISNNLPKAHNIDARCISGHPLAEEPECIYYQKKVRCHNRQIHKATILKGNIRKRNQADYEIKGFRIFDSVRYEGENYFIFGRRQSGFFDIRKLDGTKVNNGSISYKKLKFIGTNNGMLTEMRKEGRLLT